MSNALNVAATASDIIAALAEAQTTSTESRENSAAAKARADGCTLRGYALAAIAIRTLLDQDLWTTGRQKKGVVSASQALKDALITEAKANKVSPAKAKRLIEKAAALVVPTSSVHVPALHVAASQSADDAVKALRDAGFQSEKNIINHVSPPVTDVVARLMKAVSKLEGADRKGFIREIVSHEIIDDILPEANKQTAEEREAARKAQAEAAKKPKQAKVNTDARAKARAEREAKKAEPKAKPVPKSAGSKKGDATKAKKEAAPADPFAN